MDINCPKCGEVIKPDPQDDGKFIICPGCSGKWELNEDRSAIKSADVKIFKSRHKKITKLRS